MTTGPYARSMMTVDPSGSDFWSLALKLPGDAPETGGCWEWQGNVNVEGYPRCKVAGRVLRANRFAWELVHGHIPAGWVIWHTCGNIRCVRPDHLEALPKREQCLRSRRAVTPERFWSLLERSPEPDGCWLWQGYRTREGYGYPSVRGKLTRAHRYAWTLTNGPIPDGLDITHRCGNNACARPDHLELATPSDLRRRYWNTVTQCKHGHPRTPENLYIDAEGSRLCRLCRKESMRRYNAKRHARVTTNETTISSDSAQNDRREARRDVH